jgi:type VI secretion system secreted protein VgrG
MSLLSFTAGGHDLVVADLHGHTALSALFRFDLMAFSTGDPPALADLIGAKATITVQDRFDKQLVVRGLVMAVERIVGFTGGGGFSISVEPEVAALGVGRDSRVFQEMSAVDIIKKVLDKAGIAAAEVEWSTTGSYPTRHYCAQYRESDWDFIERLCAEEGIYYRFDFGDDATKLVFADDSTTAPELEGGAEIPYQDGPGLMAARDSVTGLTRRHATATAATRLREYNFEKPKLLLDSKAGSGPLELYDVPGRFQVPSEGDRLAAVRLAALRAQRLETLGETSSTRIRTGLFFAITDHPMEALNGRQLADSVLYEGSEHRTTGGKAEQGLRIRWSAIPAATPFRKSLERPVVQTSHGPQTGVVVGASGEEIHPDTSGRVRVQFYWDREGKRDETSSTWMRIGQFALGGSMIIPRVGWDVLVNHHEGDIDEPFVASHLYDGQFPVPYALPANKTRTAWQTATTPGGGSTNEIRYEDKAGGEEIFINASKNMNVVVGDNKTETVGVDSTETIGANLDVSVGSNLKLGVKSKQDVSIGASESLTVSGGRVVSVAGSETISIGGSRTGTFTGGTSLAATGGRTLSVGGTMMAASALGVNRSLLGSFTLSVAGSWINAAGTGCSNAVGGACSETVGGAKIQAGGAGCKTNVKGAAAETVGGAYVMAAGGNVGETATGSLAITVGGAFLGNAPTIEIEAKSEISIRVGGSSVSIKDGTVEIKAPTIASPGATIKKKASSIKHN